VMLAVLLGFAVASSTAGALTLSVTGPEETVYNWDTMHCNLDIPDVPDIPARAYRDALGRTQLTIGGPNTRMIGSSLDNLTTHDCNKTLSWSLNSLPSEYNDAEWIGGTYTLDGQEVFALIHSEYHGTEHAGFCGDSFQKCRFNTVTYAHSTDTGNSYTQPAAPDHLVASVPYRYVPGDARYGYFSPSNIIEKDGWYYDIILVSAEYKRQKGGVCLIRTQTLGDPRSWRAWDGEGFNAQFVDPYRESPEPTVSHVCEPIGQGQITDLNRSIVYATNAGKYVMIGKTRAFAAPVGGQTPGIFYTTSDDLIHWTDRQFLMATEDATTYTCGDPEFLLYPALLDSNSPDRNFDSTDGNLYLYLTKGRHENCISITWKRDMVRYPIQISP
jgi:hypothetical protein